MISFYLEFSWMYVNLAAVMFFRRDVEIVFSSYISNVKWWYCIVFQDTKTGLLQIWFVFQKTKYLYDSEEKKRFQPVAFPVDLTIRQYMECKGYQEDDLKVAEDKYGKNK